MKILHIIRSANPEGGGPIEGIKQLSKITLGRGHNVELLSLDDPESPFLKTCFLPIHAMGPGLGKYGYSRKFAPWLEAHAHEYDAFIINGIWQYHSFAAHGVLRRLHRPYFVYTHGMLDPWFKHQYPLKHLKKWLYWPWGEYRVLRDAQKVLFTCNEERLLARKSFWLYRCNEQVVNYGTAGHAGNPEHQREAFYQQFPHLQGKRFLLFLSRIHPKKGLDLLIEAFAQVAAEDGDLHLVLAGPDQVGWQASLQELADKLGIAGRISWVGMLQGDLKWGAYQAAEAFILPSHQENFGIVVAEALSCNLPVLISNKVNIWREIVEDNAGLVVDDTVSACVDLLHQWISLDPAHKATLAENARQCFLNRFEISKAGKDLLGLLENLPK